ncbi:SunI/YnzG family protein [Paenibacillus sp. An7]|uniref:SunI/YnzG family protein n=1 Tax=Paenibacillus sp. An7 TaxID=2689577 RepID=UPI00135AABA3|nr:hypothetical protein [Paenibacillus sp. An7]
MLGIKIEKTQSNLVIKWQLTKIDVPINEIEDVIQDNTYAGNEKEALRIGTPYGTTDRIVIKTKSKDYILFTSNPVSLNSKIIKFLR